MCTERPHIHQGSSVLGLAAHSLLGTSTPAKKNNNSENKPLQWTEPALKIFWRARRKILSHSFLPKKGPIKSCSYEQEPFLHVQWELDQALLQQFYCLTKETFRPHLSLTCKEDSGCGKTNSALPCKVIVAAQSPALLPLTSQNSRIPRENRNPGATGITGSVTRPLCSPCSFLYLQ